MIKGLLAPIYENEGEHVGSPLLDVFSR